MLELLFLSLHSSISKGDIDMKKKNAVAQSDVKPISTEREAAHLKPVYVSFSPHRTVFKS